MTDRIRLLVVDDHMLVRSGVINALGASPDIEIVGEADNGEEGLYLCSKANPDVVLMDVHMAGMGGCAVAKAISEHYPQVAVIALTVANDQATMREMVAAGAKGFLPKSVTKDELIAAIRRVHAGEAVIDALPDMTAEEPSRETHATAAPTNRLATQQRRVLALMTKGFTNSEIAEYLSISVPTARYHVSAVLAKLGASNRAEAVATAVRESLISQSDF
ncbi:response regulator [Sphingosinithalassobacter portus]|uniref:response regulator n=1 Tax=Stakelama portus TaxID=2676234 RepID=UPI000D6E84DC|nr:response regulator transcription factor [Sphingosinithalassobacter portus]